MPSTARNLCIPQPPVRTADSRRDRYEIPEGAGKAPWPSCDYVCANAWRRESPIQTSEEPDSLKMHWSLTRGLPVLSVGWGQTWGSTLRWAVWFTSFPAQPAATTVSSLQKQRGEPPEWSSPSQDQSRYIWILKGLVRKSLLHQGRQIQIYSAAWFCSIAVTKRC